MPQISKQLIILSDSINSPLVETVVVKTTLKSTGQGGYSAAKTSD